MASVSTSRKLGIAARVATRVIAQQARRTRTFGAATKAVRATASHFGRVLGQLWLEVTGFVFLFLAGIGAVAFLREYTKYQAGHATSSRVVLALCFTGLFGWFGVSSFWRVRKRGQNH
jgi:ABC-type phosphate transport system permease subunit